MDLLSSPLHLLLLGGILALAAVGDMRRRRIPNGLTAALFVLGLGAQLQLAGGEGLKLSLGGSLLALVLLLVPFARGYLGAGDVKLMVATGAWLGPRLIVLALAVGFVIGSLVSVIHWLRLPAALRREIGQNLTLFFRYGQLPEVVERPAALCPAYAPALALGICLVVAAAAKEVVLG